ncbi:MAG: toprim domain-containing protein, partial [Ruminiclostridium sp.]|nr:toprim domain-containing protein [Ruminiclostridium sp.]
LFVFEAPIDMLSFITLYQQDWKWHSYIAMNGVYENAVLEALKCHSNLDKVVLCTDNDVGGIDAADRLRDILRENGYANIFRIMPRNKDFNEDLKELHGLTPITAAAHLRKELFSENVSQLEFTPINLNRVADSLNVALSRKKYTDISNIAVSASAEILAKVNEKPVDDIFENVKKHLMKEYRAYADRDKIFSKMDTLKKAHFEAVKNLRNYPATKEQMKCIAKSLFDLADSALKCSTEQKMSEQQEQDELPQQAAEIKVSM